MPTPPIPYEENEVPKAGPSGATDRQAERVKKFEEEGGDQPQARSEKQAEEELEKAREANDDEPHIASTQGTPPSMPGRAPTR